MAREGGGGRVQEGQMAVSVGSGAGGGWQGARWGRRSGSKEGQMTGEVGCGREQEGQMAVAGVVGGRRVAGDRSSRGGQPVTRSGNKGQLEARGGSKGQMGLGHWRQDGGIKVLG